MLSLSEKLFLLSVHPVKGGIIFSVSQKLDFALIGALFLEMVLDKKIEIENKRVKLIGLRSDDSLHNYLFQKMRKSKKPRKITGWMSKFRMSVKRIRRQVKTRLVRKQMLRLEEKHFLFFRWNKPVVLNKQVVYKLQTEIASQIFGGTYNEEELMLLSLIKPAGLLKTIFPEKERRRLADKKLKQIMQDNQVSEAVNSAVAAAQAVTASVIASSVAISAAGSG